MVAPFRDPFNLNFHSFNYRNIFFDIFFFFILEIEVVL